MESSPIEPINNLPHPKRVALEKLITICRAGRAGRDLRLVPAFAEIEGDLLRQLATLPEHDQQHKPAA